MFDDARRRAARRGRNRSTTSATEPAKATQRTRRPSRIVHSRPANGRAGDDDAFAQRDDDEQRAALGHVTRPRCPSRSASRAADARHPEISSRPGIFDRQRRRPTRQARRAGIGSAPRIQNGAAGGEPDARCAACCGVASRPFARIAPGHEQRRARAASRDRRRAKTRPLSPNASGCSRSTSPGCASITSEDHQPHRSALGIEPVGRPGHVHPRPPHREEQHRAVRSRRSRS